MGDGAASVAGVAGVVLVDKPAGISSHGAVAQVRRALGTRRVGHAGTLDPDASGLLVVGVGPATRLLTFLVGLPKCYEATVRLGIATTTDDAAGAVTSSPGCPSVPDLGAALARFRGPMQQRPSAVSAVKVGGRRAYERVRAGEKVELAERQVTVHRLDVSALRQAFVDATPVVDVDVELRVSSGTYIRALARDLGAELGVGAHLTQLRRTAVGPFDVTSAVAVDDVTSADLRPLGEVASAVLPVVTVTGGDIRLVAHGVRLPCPPDCPAGPVALTDPSGDLLGVASGREGRWEYAFVVPT